MIDNEYVQRNYCKLKEDYRIFKIARIKEIKILEEHFERELPKEEEKKNIILKGYNLN